ncbi:UGMP family protein [archaeon]|nr:UGMP family protein [archaeon]|tara:strand:+ start:2815 stop:3816 length:1002 start_codon:yes stop_codon:yes gene_type:complete
MENLICLGIEATAHTFGASIVLGSGKILSDVKETYTNEKGGIIPMEAANHHAKIGLKIIEQAIKDANIKEENIDIISFSASPGLAPSLIQGMKFAKDLALKLKVPLIGVNHLTAHLEIGKLLTKVKNPVFILATGANTQIIALEGNKYRIFGEALSIGIGNALDKFGRSINLGFPAGPKIEQLAKKGSYVELPYVVKGMDIEFSGIITKASDLYKQKKASKEDLCFSLQETLFSMLTEVSERALAHTEKSELLLIGGVAANKRLSEMLNIMCQEREAKFSVVPIQHSMDHGAMIAWTGILQYKTNTDYYKNLKLEDIDINPRQRIDEKEINWV